MGDRSLTNRNRRVKAKSSDEDVFFSSWFHLINLRLLGVSVYKNDQGIVNKEEANEADVPDTGGANTEKADGADVPDIDRADVE